MAEEVFTLSTLRRIAAIHAEDETEILIEHNGSFFRLDAGAEFVERSFLDVSRIFGAYALKVRAAWPGLKECEDPTRLPNESKGGVGTQQWEVGSKGDDH